MKRHLLAKTMRLFGGVVLGVLPGVGIVEGRDFCLPSSGSQLLPIVVWARESRSIYTQNHIPYFTLHPPVYYTHPVGRPYGWSPFAYPAWLLRPELASARPMVILNPYVVGFDPHRSTDSALPNFRLSTSGCLGVAKPGRYKSSSSFSLSDRSAVHKSPAVRIFNPYVAPQAKGEEDKKALTGKEGEQSPPFQDSGSGVYSTASIQPRRIRNPYVKK